VTAFWIDHTYDAAHASEHGGSRYADHLRLNADRFVDIFSIYDDDRTLAAEFAAEAWRIATGPVMTPGYVRSHRRIGGAGVVRNQWDGSLAGAVELIMDWPRALADDHSWHGGSRWRDWPSRDGGIYTHPSDQDLTECCWLLSTAKALFTLDLSQLPDRPTSPDDPILGAIATWTVAVLVDQMNAVVTPILARLDGRT
jgi:hypothetical protein